MLQPLDVLADEAEPVIGIEQPRRAVLDVARLFLEHRFQRFEIAERAELVDGGLQQLPLTGREPGYEVAVRPLARGEPALETVEVGGVGKPDEDRDGPNGGHRERGVENELEERHECDSRSRAVPSSSVTSTGLVR